MRQADKPNWDRAEHPITQAQAIRILCVCLFVWHPKSLSLSLFGSVFLNPSLYFSLCMFVCFSVSWCMSHYLSLFFSIPLSLPHFMSAWLSLYQNAVTQNSRTHNLSGATYETMAGVASHCNPTAAACHLMSIWLSHEDEFGQFGPVLGQEGSQVDTLNQVQRSRLRAHLSKQQSMKRVSEKNEVRWCIVIIY